MDNKNEAGAVKRLAAAEEAHRRMADFKNDVQKRLVWRGQCVKLLLAALGEGPSLGSAEQKVWEAMSPCEKAAWADRSRAELEAKQPGSVRVAQGLLAALKSQQAVDTIAESGRGDECGKTAQHGLGLARKLEP